MGHSAWLTTTQVLTRKGKAKPTLVHDTEHRLTTNSAVTWHPAAIRRLKLTPVSTTINQPPARKSVRASVRLEPELHRQLKSMAQNTGRTQQSILVEALDEYFARRTPEPNLYFETFKGQVPR